MNTKIYSQAEALNRVQRALPSWQIENGCLCREIKTANWRASMAIANQISDLAEAADHHPDLLIAWGRVHITLMTHDVGGLSDRDFSLAAAIENGLNH
jgi:4a-hydroxytetrahydrobiopterin dehydratase